MSRLDARLRLPQLAAFIAMVSVTIAQVTVGFFAIDRLGLDAAAGARMAGIALTAVGVGLILAQALVMKLEVHPRRWIVLGA
ncbi:MFS transporter, partial [Pseudomonas syringae pv. tagetis]